MSSSLSGSRPLPTSQLAVDLSVVIPAFNEASRLGSSLQRIVGYLVTGGQSFEIVVVDDGSTDATTAVAARYTSAGVRSLSLAENRGKGYALRQGVAVSHGRRVLISDADLSTPIAELARLEPRLADAELVLGSRAVAGARLLVRQPLYRELMGKTFNLLLRLLGFTVLRDTQCGFKLLRGDVARELFALLTVDRFAYDVELVWLARRRGYRVVEVGVEWAHSPATTVRPLVDSARMLADVLRLRWRHRGESRRVLAPGVDVK